MTYGDADDPIGVPCASGRHEDGHYVTLVGETWAACQPPCEAAARFRLCHHVTEARERLARRLERERMRLAREIRRSRATWLDDINVEALEERIAAERVLVAEGMRE